MFKETSLPSPDADRIIPSMRLSQFMSMLYNAGKLDVTHSLSDRASLNNQKHVFVAKPLPVNFVARTYPVVPFLHPDHPTLRILGAIMAPELHKEIREKGGAYGSRSAVDSTGIFKFSSYRDPNTIKSIHDIDKVIQWICNRTDVPITTQQINEAKLKAFQAIDAPHSKVRSWFPYLLHKPAIVNDEIRRLYRLKLLEVNESNLVSACVQYLEKNENRSRMSIIGNKDEVPEEIKSSEEWIIVNEELSV